MANRTCKRVSRESLCYKNNNSSTTANRTAALTTTIDKLSRNGYPKKWLTAKKQRRKKKDKTKPSFTLWIPFVSDQLNHQIKRILRRASIPARLVNPRGQTIKISQNQERQKQQKNVQANSVRHLTYVTVQTLSTWPLAPCAMRLM